MGPDSVGKIWSVEKSFKSPFIHQELICGTGKVKGLFKGPFKIFHLKRAPDSLRILLHPVICATMKNGINGGGVATVSQFPRILGMNISLGIGTNMERWTMVDGAAD